MHEHGTQTENARPVQKHATPYKQFLLTLSAIFPVTILVPWVLRPLF